MSESNADYYGGSPGAPTLEHDPFHKELAKTDTKQDRATKPSVNVGGTALGTGSPKGRGYDTNDQVCWVLILSSIQTDNPAVVDRTWVYYSMKYYQFNQL